MLELADGWFKEQCKKAREEIKDMHRWERKVGFGNYRETEHLYFGTPMYTSYEKYKSDYCSKIGVVAFDEEEAQKTIIDYCMHYNPNCSRDKWKVENLKEQELVSDTSLEQTVETLRKAGIKILETIELPRQTTFKEK